MEAQSQFADATNRYNELTQQYQSTKDEEKKAVQTITQIEADLEGKALEAKNAHRNAV